MLNLASRGRSTSESRNLIFLLNGVYAAYEFLLDDGALRDRRADRLVGNWILSREGDRQHVTRRLGASCPKTLGGHAELTAAIRLLA